MAEGNGVVTIASMAIRTSNVISRKEVVVVSTVLLTVYGKTVKNIKPSL